MTQIERAAYNATADGAELPSPLSYQPGFSSFYDFSPGRYDITDTAGGAEVVLVDGGSGYDTSGLDIGGPISDASGSGYVIYGFGEDDLGDLLEPVILDLTGNGIDITPRTDSTVYFDADGDGWRERTAWAGPQYARQIGSQASLLPSCYRCVSVPQEIGNRR